METEIWKDIPGYEGHYMVSNTGYVQSMKINGRLLKPSKLNGYLCVQLSLYGKVKKYTVHRIVASAFLGLDLHSFTDRKKSLCVLHKNDIRNDNRVENLFLGTNRDNAIDRELKGRGGGNMLCGEKNKFFGIKWYIPEKKPVVQYTIEGVFIKQYPCAKDASKEAKLSSEYIANCCRGRYKKAGGFIWKFLSNVDKK